METECKSEVFVVQEQFAVGVFADAHRAADEVCATRGSDACCICAYAAERDDAVVCVSAVGVQAFLCSGVPVFKQVSAKTRVVGSAASAQFGKLDERFKIQEQAHQAMKVRLALFDAMLR